MFDLTFPYRCQHFIIEELVDPETHRLYGERAWQFFDVVALYSLDGIREFFDASVTVNNWIWGGRFTQRGYRGGNTQIGAVRSQHRNGRAFDCDIKGVSAEDARRQILAHQDAPRLRFITCLETDVSWLHFDCRNIPDRILLVKP